MTAADGAGYASTNTQGLTGLTKDVGDAIVNEAGCDVSTRYPTVPLLRLQCTDAAHVFRKPFTSVIYVCIGTPSIKCDRTFRKCRQYRLCRIRHSVLFLS